MAVASALGDRAEILWIGGEGGMEASIVARHGIAFEAVPAAGVHGVGLRALPGNALQLMRGWREAKVILKRFQPDVLFFTGGYVGVPVSQAGRSFPSVMYVPDIEPALALKWIGRTVDVVAVTAPESRHYFPQDKRVEVTGYPIRPSLREANRDEARKFFDLTDDPVLLVFGGSRGARSINEALWKILPALLNHTQVLHVTGELDWPRVKQVLDTLPESKAANYHPCRYLHEEMGLALAAADLVVSRAGAATMGEYPHFGLPSILVPYPHAWRYQKDNAAYLESRAAGVVLPDERLGSDLYTMVSSLLSDPARLKSMSQAAAWLAVHDAAESIATLLLEIGQEGGTRG